MTNKAFVSNTAIGGALATILVWAVNAFGGVEVPAEAAAAFATLLGALAGSVGEDPA